MSTGTSSMMTGMPGGATSKGDSDKRMTARNIKKMMRGASLAARDLPDPGEAFEKASGGVFTKVDGELRQMSAISLQSHMSTNAADLSKMGTAWVEATFNRGGMKQAYDTLKNGAAAEHTTRVQTQIKAALLSKSVAEMKPEELEYLKDKFRELGVNLGDDKGDNGPLFSAIGNFLSDQPSLEKQVMAKGPVLRPN